MSVDDTEHDPNATIWRAVGQLELKGYTKKEIYDALNHVADAMRVRPFNRGDSGDDE